MDHIEVDVLAGIPPDVMSAAYDDLEFGSFDGGGPGIDVPFTEVAQRVLDRSEEFAEFVGSDAVLTEHLQLAISSTPECAAAKLIQEHQGSSESLLSALQFVLGAFGPPNSENCVSPRLERVIIRAKREAFRHKHPEVTTVHLLMALIKERSGAAGFPWETPAYGQ